MHKLSSISISMIKRIKYLTKSVLHRVTTGETLDSIAHKYGTTTQRIIRDNPYYCGLYVGCLLYISKCNAKIYVVQPLDNIASIAQKLGCTEADVEKIAGSKVVFVGQILEYEEN